VDIGKLREEALALNTQAQELFGKIVEGEEPYEKYQEAEKMLADAGQKMDLTNSVKTAQTQHAALTEGVGSLTAATPPPDETPESKSAWPSFGHFLAATAALRNPAVRAKLEEKHMLPDGWEKKLLQEAIGAVGGFLVPVAYRPEMFEKAYESAIVRPRATVIPMTTVQLQMPSMDQTINPAAPKSAFMAGTVFQWIEEATEKPEVEMLFKLIDLIVHEYAGWIPVSNNLIADSVISLEALIRAHFVKTAVAYEDWHFLNGSGVGQPQGVITAGATIQNTRTGAGIVWADISGILHAFQPGANGVWVINHCCLEEILALQDTATNYMWIPNMRDGVPERLMGYPIIWTEKVPALGSKGDIGLYDFSYYLIGDREAPTVDSDTSERFRYNQTTFRLSARVDGKPWLTAPVKIMPAGATSISPFVNLKVYVGG